MKNELSAKRKLELYKLADFEAGNMKMPGMIWPDQWQTIPAATEIDSEMSKQIEDELSEEQPIAEPATDAEKLFYWQAVAEKRKALFELLTEQYKELEARQGTIEDLGGKIEEQGKQTRKTIEKQRTYTTTPEEYAQTIREIAETMPKPYYERMKFSAQTVRNWRSGKTQKTPEWFSNYSDNDITRIRRGLELEQIFVEKAKRERQLRDALRRPEQLPDEM